MFGGLAAPVVRAAMAKCAPPEDTGVLRIIYTYTPSQKFDSPIRILVLFRPRNIKFGKYIP